MTAVASTVRAERALLAAVLVATSVVIVPGAVEKFMLPKATVLVLGAVALVALAAVRAAWTRRLSVPVSPVTLAVGAFAVALVLATATSPSPWVSLVGFYGRYTGLVPYLACLVVFLVVLARVDHALVRLLTRVAVVALALVSTYGLLQAAGVDPVRYDETFNRNFSFLGNSNFGAAWAAAVSPLALVLACDREQSRAWRLAAAVLLPVALAYVVVTRTSQGVVVALAALGFAVLVLSTAPDGAVRRLVGQHRLAAAGAAAAGVLAVAALVVLRLPALRTQLDQALVERPDFWRAALSILADRPVLGTGLDTFAHHFLAYRPAAHAVANGPATTDAPHSVALGMFSNGGLLLGLTHLAVVVLVGVVLVRGAWRAAGTTRAALAGFGGVWLGYQLQALVSFDVPPLVLLHWLSAVVVGLAAPPRWREVVLPGTAARQALNKRGKPVGPTVVPTSTRLAHVGVGLVALALVWLSVQPLRADLVSASAGPQTATSQFNAASATFERAAELNPGEATYSFLAARAALAAGRTDRALALAGEAAERDPGTVQYPLFLARESAAAGRREDALRWFQEAVSRDPRDPPVLDEVAEQLLAGGVPDEALPLAERSVALLPDAPSLTLLGRARAAVGDVRGARQAFQRALREDRSYAEARAGLASLPGAP